MSSRSTDSLNSYGHVTDFIECALARVTNTTAQKPRCIHVRALQRTPACGNCTLESFWSFIAQASAHIHSTRPVVGLPPPRTSFGPLVREIIQQMCGKIPLKIGQSMCFVSRCAVGDTRSSGWDSEHRQRCRAKRIT